MIALDAVFNITLTALHLALNQVIACKSYAGNVIHQLH